MGRCRHSSESYGVNLTVITSPSLIA
jgi:hypothetical protein